MRSEAVHRFGGLEHSQRNYAATGIYNDNRSILGHVLLYAIVHIGRRCYFDLMSVYYDLARVSAGLLNTKLDVCKLCCIFDLESNALTLAEVNLFLGP